jgi:hypothetical protein
MEDQKHLPFKKVEKMLFHYNKIRHEIINIKIDIEELKDDVAISSAALTVTESGKNDGKKTLSTVEMEVLKRERKILELEKEVRSKERLLRKIDNAVSYLSPQDQSFLRARYFEGVNIEGLMRIYHLDRTTVYKKKNSIIRIISSFFKM